MIFISRIKMRGFKSFKLADLIFPKDFICFAGPNGSGKSNVCDAIRFAFGEKSLRALRVRKVKDLICHNSKLAEVTVYLDGDEKHEIKRAIREDGKILYKLDGARTTRTSVVDLLKRFNIDESGRNVIAQGEVTRIINMNPKDRRTIIDSVAGISEFEEKKKEALRDVEIVETRLRESNLIMGEKLGMLNELAKEKELAQQYNSKKKQFTDARGSLVKNEMDRATSDLEKAIIDIQKINSSLKTKTVELEELDKKIKDLENEKGKYLEEVQLRQQQNALVKEVEDLRLELGKAENEIEEKMKLIAKSDSEILLQIEESKKQSEELKETEISFRKNEEELSSLKPKRNEAVHLTSASALRRTIEADKARLSSNREELARVEGEISKYIELASEKESASNHSESPEEGREEKIRGEMEILSKEVMGARSDLESLFEREKHLNSEVAELDRKILQAREQLASVRAQHPHLSSAAISNVVNQMNVKKSKTGVHGALIDLIKFDSKYSRAVEAAAGQRLRYLVVDSADVATKIISEMKKTGEGRATFIPLKEISAPRSIDSQDGLGPIFNYVKFNAKFENAAKYALGETLLVQDMSQAKKIGMGKYRMVTLDGEIFERSGVISGGRLSSGIAAASTIAKLDTELAELKNARESLFSEISNLREEMSSLRSIRAEKEVKLKSMEMELSALATESEKAKHELEEMEKKYAEASSLKEKAKSLQLRKAELEKLSADLVEKISKEEGKLANEESEAAKLNEEANKKHTELVSRISALEAKRDALVSEIKLRKSNLYKLETSIKQMQAEKATHSSKVSELERKLRSWKNQLIKKEEEVASSSKELESLFKKMKQSDEKIQEIGKQRGAISYEYEKLNKELNSINTKKTIAETKLTDLKAEFDSFQEFEYLEKSKDELMGLAKEANSFLMANPNVNLAALELYEKKKAEIGDMGDKIKKLEEEKEAILNMIKEIDGRKKETFFHMFYSINDNFKDMFKYIPNIGDGYLYLNKPADPFESGLLIKVKRGTKEIELDSLSGGEKTLIVIMFMFALQFVKPSPYYILDEADSALDKENSKNLAKLVRETSKDSQFIVVTHNDMFMTFASAVFGVSKSDGVSKIVGVKLGEKIEQEAKASG